VDEPARKQNQIALFWVDMNAIIERRNFDEKKKKTPNNKNVSEQFQLMHSS
jgi:hypothetical protein